MPAAVPPRRAEEALLESNRRVASRTSALREIPRLDWQADAERDAAARWRSLQRIMSSIFYFCFIYDGFLRQLFDAATALSLRCLSTYIAADCFDARSAMLCGGFRQPKPLLRRFSR